MKNIITILLIGAVAGSVNIKAGAALSSPNIKKGLKIGNRIDVTINELEDGLNLEENGLGVVPGYRSCGGVGKLLQMRYETCSGESYKPCKVPGDNVMRQAEIQFVPSEDIESLSIRLLASTFGIPSVKLFERSIEDSAVRVGSKYSINANVGATPMFIGNMVKLQFEIFRENDNVVEICSVADFEIV